LRIASSATKHNRDLQESKFSKIANRFILVKTSLRAISFPGTCDRPPEFGCEGNVNLLRGYLS
jgi:hypothetical protein